MRARDMYCHDPLSPPDCYIIESFHIQISFPDKRQKEVPNPIRLTEDKVAA